MIDYRIKIGMFITSNKLQKVRCLSLHLTDSTFIANSINFLATLQF
uniref:Uncharacterized protein n=1 Tax=Ciona intestinalis TaxID=7719 RepID=F6YDH1_CIOIN